MEHDNELAESKARAEQLIGRNVLLFQEMEQLLKTLLPRATVSISSEIDALSMMPERSSAVETCTLGTLVKRFISEVCDPNEQDPTGDSDHDQVNLTVAIRLRFDAPDGRDVMIQRLNDLVDGRNRLVHHLLSKVDVNSPASWRSIHDDLEHQHQQVLSEIETMQHLVDTMAMSGAFVAHPEIRRELAYGPIREQLIEKLLVAARESTEPDGWTSLKAAIRSDGAVSSDAVLKLLGGYEIPTVSAFLQAVGGFEIRHDKDRKGRTRTLYRATGTQSPTATDSTGQET